ncbi:hypothetical protein [Domibacillus aminovorans]|uniref:hypothetical protein n=1 Tax=Domibacillus aminovorans TaxID=29332 RepID=UPI00268B887C
MFALVAVIIPVDGEEELSGIGRYYGEWVIGEFTTVKWLSVQKKPREYLFS